MSQENLFNEAKSFFQVFEPKGEIITGVKVPGCVQIIGEVADFNRGKIIAANLDKSALMLAQKRKEKDRSVHFYSRKYDEKIRMLLNEPQLRNEDGWANYMSSTLFMLEGSSKKVPGMNVFIDNRIPDQFNSNDMEALEVAMANVAQKFGDWQLNDLETAQLCADGESKIMGRDSAAVKYIPVIMGKKASVTYFDSSSGASQVLPLDINGYVFLMLSSGLKKRLFDDRKARIHAEVKEAIEVMRRNGAVIDGLHSLTLEQFDNYREHLSISQRKRCAFFISENERADTAKKALEAKDLKGFIDTINESQKNIKNRLEIVADENEILVDTALDVPEVKAVRLMDMGCDGTILAVVEKDKIQAVETKIKKTFLARTGLELAVERFSLTNEMEEVSINVSEFKRI